MLSLVWMVFYFSIKKECISTALFFENNLLSGVRGICLVKLSLSTSFIEASCICVGKT